MTKSNSIRIAIASGKGGTGKTLISTSLFYTLQNNNQEVTLVDCDAEEPNDMLYFSGINEKSIDVTQRVPVIDESKCTYCGKCHDYCSYKAIFILPQSKIIKVMDDLCHGCGACTVACKFDAITEKSVLLGEVSCYNISSNSKIIESRTRIGVYSPVPIIKSAISEAKNQGIILMDSPPGTSCPFIQTVAQANYVILVTEPTPFGLSDLKQSVETLKTMGKPYGVIVNRAGLGNNQIYSYFKEEGIALLMEIPFDREIASIYSKGLIIAHQKPELQLELLNVLNIILAQHGNSNN
jgi:MinD superfamily P-loop ATPase